MKTSKYSKVVCAGLIAVSTVVPNMQQRINAYEVDETDIVSEEAQFASKESSVSEVVPTTDATQETENVTVQQNDEVVYPTGITIDNTLLNLGIGDEKDIRVVSWSGAQNWDKNTGISWSSSNPEIVSVNANGKIVALRNGEAIITATVVGNPSVSASCMVYVSDEAAEETYPTRLTLASTKKLDEGESEKLSVGYGGSPTNKELIWTTSDENVAKVSEDGTVTATGVGTAIVTATSVGKNNGQEEPASASCTVTVTGLYEGFKYNVENNEITITGYSGSETSIQIPATIHGKQVTKIQDNAFTSKKFASVVIPEGVTTLGKNAFRANRSLTQLTLPSTISVIGQGAFSMCESLVDVVIPEGVTQISTDAFNDCESLVNVTLPKSLKTIGSNAFADCTSLTTIKLPDNLQSITSTSFEKTVTIQVNEGSATADLLDERNISYQIINSEIYPTTIGLNEDEKTLTQGETFQLRLNSYSGNPTNKDLIWSTDNETVATVDENGLVTAVGEGTAVITGTSVGVAPGATEPAFDTCTIHVEGVEGDYVYTVTDGNVTIEDYLGTDTEIVIPSTIAGKPVTEIGPMSFWMDDNMTSVVIPEGVTTIGKQAFNGNDNLANIKLPSTLKTIGERAFWGTAITELNVPEGVTSIGREAFNSCKELSSVTLPESLTYIGPNAFNRCDALTDIVLPDNITYVGTNGFGNITLHVNKGSKTETTLKNANIDYVLNEIYPTTIGLNEDEKTLTQGETFQLRLNSYSGNPTNKDLIWSTDNETVATVDENGLVTAVGEGTAVITGTSVGVAPGATEPAFDTCTIHVEGVEGDYVYTVTDGNVTIEDYLGTDTEIVIPSTIAGKPVTEIGPMSFWMDDNMTSVVIPEGVTTIGKQAFNGNDNLANIKLPSTLKTIGERAFWGTAITELNVPEGVTSIGREAFNSCKELSSVTLPESLTYIGPNAFNSCPSLNEIRLPSNIISLGTNALRGFDKIYVKEGSTTETALKNGGYTYSYYTDVTPITNTVPSIIAEDVILTVGDQFDPMKNVQASDNEDGDLTDQIKVLENTVNVEKPGIYSLIYYVEDVQGASCTKTIKVTVNAKEESKPSSDQNGNKKEESKKSTTDTKKTKGTNTGVGLEIGLFSSLIVSSVIGAGILSMLKKKK